MSCSSSGRCRRSLGSRMPRKRTRGQSPREGSRAHELTDSAELLRQIKARLEHKDNCSPEERTRLQDGCSRCCISVLQGP